MKERILIIDDEDNFCQLVKKSLELGTDLELIIAINGKQGIELAKKIKPDLILLDVLMPNMDGFEVLEILKKNEATMEIPVVMLTALEDEASKTKAWNLYCEDSMTKPVDFVNLKSNIDEILKRKKMLVSEHMDIVNEKIALKEFIFFWGPVLFWAVVIFGLSSIPSKYLPVVPIPYFYKIGHFVEYSILGALLFRVFKHIRPQLSNFNLMVASVFLIMTFAGSDEWHQTFVPGRVGCISDVIFDTIYSGIGVFLYMTKKHR